MISPLPWNRLLSSLPLFPDTDALTAQPVCAPAVTAAVARLAAEDDAEARGAVFTRIEVVEFILDLVGYTPDRPLHACRLLEPAAGCGEFLRVAVRRLLAAWRAAGSPGDTDILAVLGPALQAVELHHDSCRRARAALGEELAAAGIGADTAQALIRQWLRQGDFLLSALPASFDFVVGNPPYVRQELIPPVLLAEYRRRYATLYDRADLYVPFIERALSLLAAGGRLGFICPDRWMKNRYGGPLRRLVAEGFHLQAVIDMDETPAFHSEVAAYPAIVVIARARPGRTRIAHRPPLDAGVLGPLAAALQAEAKPDPSLPDVREQQLVCLRGSDAPWLLDTDARTNLIRRIEAGFPLLEATGCRVGIGVATGADRVFIGDYASLDVEPQRKLPLAMTADLESGELRWRGLGVVNPFGDDGRLVDLRDWPRLRAYLERHRDVIAARHCARKSPGNWYRTIDRIHPALAAEPKLLIPDIKGSAHVVHEPGRLYPHHNLYYVTATAWDLHALQAVLLSGLTRAFIASYSTRMRGGYLRFQAQYLRRLRLPYWHELAGPLRQELIHAARSRNLAACDRAVAQLYGLSAAEQAELLAQR